MTTIKSLISLPFFLKKVITFLPISLKAPFHPAWTTEIIVLLGSKIIIGAQSAVKTPIGIFFWSVIKASQPILFLFVFFEIR